MTDRLPGDALQQARRLLAFQRALVGPTRFLGGFPPRPADALPIATTETPESALSLESAVPADSPPVPAAPPSAPPSPAPPAESEPRPGEDRPALSDPMASDLFGLNAAPDATGRSPYERVEALIPADSPLQAMGSLDEVRDWLQATVLTPIDQHRIKPVLGVGDPHAGLMVIGEAPGADEDRLGEPFVGRAGQLLDKILEAILFKREDVYITNILKTRPPNNRDPLPEEIAAHIPILYKQIALVRPKVILAVGKTAGNGLLGRSSSMATLRGKFNDFHGLPLMVTYHPAALLRNPDWKRPTWEDVKLLRTRYDQLVSGSPDAAAVPAADSTEG